jgi:hypothetical protein
VDCRQTIRVEKVGRKQLEVLQSQGWPLGSGFGGREGRRTERPFRMNASNSNSTKFGELQTNQNNSIISLQNRIGPAASRHSAAERRPDSSQPVGNSQEGTKRLVEG